MNFRLDVNSTLIVSKGVIDNTNSKHSPECIRIVGSKTDHYHIWLFK